MTMHAIKCKRTGEAIATKLDGGPWCACLSPEVCANWPTISDIDPKPRISDATLGYLIGLGIFLVFAVIALGIWP